VLGEAPEREGGERAHEAVVAAREGCRNRALQDGHGGAPNVIDARIHTVKASRADSVIDRIAAQTERQQLAASHVAVLPRRYGGDR
jgi:hypothetical protein